MKVLIICFISLFLTYACFDSSDDEQVASSTEDSNGDPGGGDSGSTTATTPCAFDYSSNPSGTASGSRTYNMGFTTWKYANDTLSQTQIYETVVNSSFGDIVGLHYMDGVPWGYGDTAIFNPVDLYPFYPSALQSNINGRITATLGASTLYVAVDQTNSARTDIANDYFSGNAPSFSFNDTKAHYAYTNYLLVVLYRIYKIYSDAGKTLPTLYINYSSEVSDLIVQGVKDGNYNKWDNFVTLANVVNSTLKGFTHTDSALQSFIRNGITMVSVALKSPKDSTSGNTSSDSMEAVEDQFPEVHSYIDMVGVSTYGYIFYNNQYGGGNPDTSRADSSLLESNWLSQALGSNIAGSMNVGITETGWLASNYDVNMDGTYVISSDASRQNSYLDKLLTEMDGDSRWKFLMWFTVADYDPLWSSWDSSTKIAGLTWLSTGLFDTSASDMTGYNNGCILNSRPAWTTWSKWLSKSKI